MIYFLSEFLESEGCFKKLNVMKQSDHDLTENHSHSRCKIEIENILKLIFTIAKQYPGLLQIV